MVHDDCQFLRSGVKDKLIMMGKDILNARLDYKFEEIYDREKMVIGYEVLVYKAASINGSYFSSNLLLDLLYERFVAGGSLDFLFGKRLFINFEVYELCEPRLLKKIVEFDRFLALKDIMLVCEITERNNCSPCEGFCKGLFYLSDEGVTLCADDFSLFGDFREESLGSLFSCVKLEVPDINSGCVHYFIERAVNLGQLLDFVVFEKVETIRQLSVVKALGVTPFYCQGYLFSSESIVMKRMV